MLPEPFTFTAVSKLTVPEMAVHAPSAGVRLSVHASLSAGTLLSAAP